MFVGLNKRIVWLAAGLLLTMNAAAQIDYLHCGTPPEPSKWLEDYLLNRAAYPKSNNVLYVPLNINLVGTDDGQGHLNVRSLLDGLCNLNKDFEPANIQFYIDGNINYINRSAYYEHNSIAVGNQMFAQHNRSNTLNSYFVSNPANLGGYASAIGGNAVVVRNSAILGHTWAHEVGHALSLLHTFAGWEGFSHNFSQNAPERVNGNRLVERVDRSNCDEAGDGFCDTPSDYLAGTLWTCAADGFSTVEQRDPIGTTFRSDGSFIMSYAVDQCMSRFSEGQIGAMRANLLTAKRNYLNRVEPLPLIPESEARANLIFPANNELVNLSGIVLEWEPVPNATNYIIEISRSVSTFPAFATTQYTSTTNRLELPPLEDNRTYFWRVRAYNRNSVCTPLSDRGQFRTTLATSTQDPAKREGFSVYPTAIFKGESVRIEVNVPDRTQLSVRLYSYAGQLLKEQHYDALTGSNVLQFAPGNVPVGLYLLGIVTAKGLVFERIVVQ